MELKLGSARIIALAVDLDPAAFATEAGPLLWATVRLTYTLAGVQPEVAIRVPVPFEPTDTDAERRRQALRHARLLIDHACRAVGPEEVPPDAVEAVAAAIAPSSPEGISQEPAKPATRPKGAPRTKR